MTDGDSLQEIDWRMLSASSSRDTGDEYEDVVFLVELQGLFDPDTVEHDIKQGRCRVGALDSEQPVVQVGSSIFVGRWEMTPGTDLLFREISHRQMLSFVGSSEKRLIAQRVLLSSSRKRGRQDEDEEDEGDDGQEENGGEQVEPREQESSATDTHVHDVAIEEEVINGDQQ